MPETVAVSESLKRTAETHLKLSWIDIFENSRKPPSNIE